MFSDSFFARQQVTYLNGSMVVGPIIIGIDIFMYFNPCCVVGMVSSCFGGINLAFVVLPYSLHLEIYRKYYWIILH